MAGGPKLKYDFQHEVSVEGIVYRLAKTEEDFEFILNCHFDQFLRDEPVTNLLDPLQPKERHPAIVEGQRNVFLCGLSLLAIDEASGQPVGMRTAVAVDKAEAAQDVRKTLSDYRSQSLPDWFADIHLLMDEICWPQDMFLLHPEDDRMLYFVTLGCHRDFRGRGIASQLVKQAFEVGRKAGCQSVVVTSTNEYSRKIFHKMGMDTVKEVYLKDYTAANGEPICPPTNQHRMTSHYMKL